jgi:hypothetical protein
MSIVTAKRFTIDEYHQMIELGFLKESDRIELMRGELIQMVAKGTLHTVCGSCRIDRNYPVVQVDSVKPGGVGSNVRYR